MVDPIPPAERMIVPEPSEAVALDVDIEEAKLTAPEKPERLVSVSAATPEDPTAILNVA